MIMTNAMRVVSRFYSALRIMRVEIRAGSPIKNRRYAK